MGIFIQEDDALKRNIQHFTRRKVLGIGRIGCPLKCQWCMNEELVFDDKMEVLPSNYSDFTSALDRISPMEHVVGFCYNEPSYTPATFVLAGEALQKGFQTFISTNGIMEGHIRDHVFEVFHLIDLDIKAPPGADIGNYTAIKTSEYEDAILTFLKEVKKRDTKINTTVLCIPEFMQSRKAVTKLVDYLNLLSPGSSVSLRAFYAMPRLKGSLTSSDMAFVKKVKEMIQPIMDPRITIYLDPGRV